MIRCGKTGAVLLHGTGCVRCDCGGAWVSFRGQEWTVEELERVSPRFTAEAEAAIRRAAAERQRRMDDDIIGAMFSGNPYARSAGGTWAGTATRQPVEIITDPNDRRGFDARPVRAA
jgi:hypothetical protein